MYCVLKCIRNETGTVNSIWTCPTTFLQNLQNNPHISATLHKLKDCAAVKIHSSTSQPANTQLLGLCHPSCSAGFSCNLPRSWIGGCLRGPSLECMMHAVPFPRHFLQLSVMSDMLCEVMLNDECLSLGTFHGMHVPVWVSEHSELHWSFAL